MKHRYSAQCAAQKFIQVHCRLWGFACKWDCVVCVYSMVVSRARDKRQCIYIYSACTLCFIAAHFQQQKASISYLSKHIYCQTPPHSDDKIPYR